jgi:pimeloyl-ACP methyl ester carboxylesterase
VGTAVDEMQVAFRTVDGIRIRCAVSARHAGPSLLLTSPWPESVYAFARIWPLLTPRFELLAVDLPGYGASEGRDDLLEPEAMGAFMVRLLEACGLQRPHLVAPDVGTVAALFAAASRPDLVASLVVGSCGAAVPIRLTGPLAEWVQAPDLDRYRAMDPRVIVGAALDTIEGDPLPAAIRADYLDSYAGDRFVTSMRYVRTYPTALPKLARRLADIATPVQIIAGGRDRVVPLVNAEFLAERLPRSALTMVDAGHFVWEDTPGEYASIVTDWVQRRSA